MALGSRRCSRARRQSLRRARGHDATRNGGYPPLMLDPIDFVALYRNRLAEMQAQGGQPAGRA